MAQWQNSPVVGEEATLSWQDSPIVGQEEDIAAQIPVSAEGLPLTAEQEVEEESKRQATREEDIFQEPGSLRDAEKIFKGFVGTDIGIDKENYPEFHKYLGFLTPIANAGGAAAETAVGGFGAGLSLAVDMLDKLGVPNADGLKRDLLAAFTESPTVAGGVTNLAAGPKLMRTSRAAPRSTTKADIPEGANTIAPDGTPIIAQANQAKVKTQGAIESGVTAINEKIDRVFPPEAKAESLLRDVLKLDKITPDNIEQMALDFELRNGRKPTLLELGGENIEGLGRKVGGEIGEGRTVIENFRTNVLEGQTKLVRDIAERTLVQPNQNFLADVNALEKQMQKQSAPLYEKAREQIITVTSDIKNMVDTPAGKMALKNAEKTLKQQGVDPASLGIIREKGKLFLADDVSVDALDHIKRGFDDIVESYRDPVTRKKDLDTFGRAVEGTLNQFKTAIDEVSPVYAEARNSYAGPASLKTALLDARNAAKKPSVTADVIRERMKGMTDSEREFYRSGFMRGLIDIMEGGVADTNRVRKLVRSEALVEKLGVVFDDPALAKQFVNQLREAEKLSGRAQRVSPSVGTTTAQRTADTSSINAMQNKGDILSSIVKTGYNKLRQNRNVRNEQLINKDISELLTQPLTDDVITAISKRLQEQK